jgi:hypothetical protein
MSAIILSLLHPPVSTDIVERNFFRLDILSSLSSASPQLATPVGSRGYTFFAFGCRGSFLNSSATMPYQHRPRVQPSHSQCAHMLQIPSSWDCVRQRKVRRTVHVESRKGADAIGDDKACIRIHESVAHSVIPLERDFDHHEGHIGLVTVPAV